jgi:large repetitive protein
MASALLLLLSFSGRARAADLDRDSLDDDWELTYFGDLAQDLDGDPDGDGLYNQQEQDLQSNPTRFDTDNDALSDGREYRLGTNLLLADSDADGLVDYGEVLLHGTDPLRRDTDGGGRGDGEEVLLDRTNPLSAGDDLYDADGDGLPNYVETRLGTDPFSTDTDGDLLSDADENPDLDDGYQGDVDENNIFEPEQGDETDPTRADTDNDGLNDGLERFFGTDPFDGDSDGDGYKDGEEYVLRIVEHGCLDPAQPDSDFDGVSDGEELEQGLDPCNADTDGDGILDATELADGTDPQTASGALPDSDVDGLSDDYELNVAGTDPDNADTDGDGLSDQEEVFLLTDHYQTDPLDADSDDDGLLDGNEGGVLVRGRPTLGTSPVDRDSDSDGATDGQERGLASPEISADDLDATALGLFSADTDPGSRTDPLDADTDNDGLSDGAEDANGDGTRQNDETDPLLFDTDRDGMDDGWEVRYAPGGSCPAGSTEFMDPTDDADGPLDFDEDGLINLAEYTLEVRVDLELRRSSTSPCDLDTDDDGLNDAAEAASSYQNGQTDPNLRDTDRDGLSDGREDSDLDGRFAFQVETDPSSLDTDGDGLRDQTEDVDGDGAVGEAETDPRRADSDGDGLPDGAEVLQYGTDPLNPDSDDDGLGDGLELGLGGDADPVSLTDPRNTDTDRDGLLDGAEDADENGRVDAGETDPADYDSDEGGVADGVERDDGTDPTDPSDDRRVDGRPAPQMPMPEPMPDELPPDAMIEGRWLLEPNAEIRGSSCSASFRGPRAAGSRELSSRLCFGALLALACWRRRSASQKGRAAGRRFGSGLSLLACMSIGPGLFLAAWPARAQATPAQIANARNTDIDVNPHRLNPAGFDLLGTSRPRVLSHLELRAAASLHHLAGPAVVADRTSGATLRRLVGNREELSVGAAIGLFERYQMSVILPIVLHQQAQLPGQDLGTGTASGVGSVVLIPRAVLIDGPVRVGVEVPVTLPLWETPAYMGYEGLGVEPRLLLEEEAGPLVFSTALGALIKPDQRVFNLRDGDQLTYAIAGQYPDAVQGWDFGLEFQGGTPLVRPGRSAETRAEVLLGARHRFDAGLSVTAGSGAGVLSGIGQSSYRIFLGVGYAGSLLGASAAGAGQPPSAPDCAPKPDGRPLPPGCPAADTDADGIVDTLDRCPAAAEDKDGYKDSDGCPEPDNDQDGILDINDGCPLEPEDKDGFKDADGCPETDNDADGLLDAQDQCPLVSEDFNGVDDSDGCPEATKITCPDGVEPTPSGQCLARLDEGLISISEPIQFAPETADLMDSSRETLDQVVDILDASPNLRINIVGHTDGRGGAASNLALSTLRANAVRFYLLAQSKSPSQLTQRIRAIGKGEAQPVDDNATAVGRARNRRVEFLIVEPK